MFVRRMNLMYSASFWRNRIQPWSDSPDGWFLTVGACSAFPISHVWSKVYFLWDKLPLLDPLGTEDHGSGVPSLLIFDTAYLLQGSVLRAQRGALLIASSHSESAFLGARGLISSVECKFILIRDRMRWAVLTMTHFTPEFNFCH